MRLRKRKTLLGKEVLPIVKAASWQNKVYLCILHIVEKLYWILFLIPQLTREINL